MDDGHDPFRGGLCADEPRRRRMAALLDRRGSADLTPSSRRSHRLPGLHRLERVCAVAVDVVGVDGAGITVMGSTEDGLGGLRDQLAATGTVSRRLEDLQLTTGEGPCLDAYRDGRPVLAADLAGEPDRWFGFGPPAVASGAAAVFSLPLQVGVIRLGTLDLHRRTAGRLSTEQLADALALAALATETLLELAEDQGDTTPEDQGDEGRTGPPGWLSDVHADVHIASGMVSTQSGIDVPSALLRIRAYAFAHEEPIQQVARHIIDRDLVLAHPDDNGSGHGPTAPDEEGEP
ncbi:GAF domain-containing protein [Actinomycetospora lemnae]|uniref:GAF domain-containing protein n=1 Tax=Actinomycetospora lemnae TaxID=3019891 RepID=A0ABT5SRD6_9PSEU|nr:GAF domain-containing protein [Actinomycetospora sp. DW7H6]MDD7965408.1 GAF domain-containing protein [Actinomycetospora sp. DW7H6]